MVSRTLWICCANSRVGASTKTWHCGSLASNRCREAMENVAVLPVPDCAWAIVSRSVWSFGGSNGYGQWRFIRDAILRGQHGDRNGSRRYNGDNKDNRSSRR